MGQPFGNRSVAVGLVVVALAASGCLGTRQNQLKQDLTRFFSATYDDPQAEAKLAEAERLVEAGQYEKAEGQFKILADNTGNTARLAERARFMQAECRRLRGHYPDAVDAYNRLLLDFPTGAHRREACGRMFTVGEYWLGDFTDELQARAGEGGVLHRRPGWPNPLDRTRPATDQEGYMLKAFENVHTHDVTGPYADKAIYWCGYVNYVRGNFQESDHYLSQLIDLHKDSPLRPQAMALAIQAKNNSTGGAVYDGRKCAEALQLIHVAEASVPELTQDPALSDTLSRARVAIRTQQAEKDLKTAEYYERTGHPGSAVFYYELVRRRYAGTRYSDLATDRKDALLADMKAGKVPSHKYDPITLTRAALAERSGKRGDPADPDAGNPVRDSGVVPAGGSLPGPATSNLIGGSPSRP